jgi:phenylalanyl-tRNA synthetase beta chain
MLFSWKWLGDYVELATDVHEGARELTDAGFAVELIDEIAESNEIDGDYALDIDVTTNRPDCMNHRGLAREIAVIRSTELRTPEAKAKEIEELASSAVTIEISDPDLCHRYVGKVVRNIKIGKSPDWLVERMRLLVQERRDGGPTVD